MAYKIRVILNAKTDVIRDIAIEQSETLEDLHNAITNAFGFSGHEMASFYEADNEWNQGEEFPLFDMSEESNDDNTMMSEVLLENVLTKANEKLIYVYDFFNMWSFYVELIETDFDAVDFSFPSLVFSLGAIPKNAPDLVFEKDTKKSKKSAEDFEDFDDDDFDDDDLDDFDEYDDDIDAY
jgi:hypothetical protein